MDTWLIALASFIPMLLLLVVIHELGHFWTAKAFGIKVLEFGVGFPPRAFGIYTGRSELLLDHDTDILNGATADLRPGQLISVLSGETHDGRLVARYIELPAPRNGGSVSSDGSVGGNGNSGGSGLLARLRSFPAGRRQNPDHPAAPPRARRLNDVAANDLLRHEGRVREIGDGRIVLADMIYSVNWLPIGGFVRMPGESDPRAPHSLARRQPWQRAIVLAAGSAMNALFPVIAFAVIFMLPHSVPLPGTVEIKAVTPDSPAAVAGLLPGDRVLAVNGAPVNDIPDLPATVRASAGAEMLWQIDRDGRQLPARLTPRANPPSGQASVGIRFGPIEERRIEPPWTAARLGVVQTWNTLELIWTEIRSWFGGEGGSGRGPEFSGPIGIARVAGEVTRQSGFEGWMTIAILLSINLAILNILPFPMLDGGRLLFVCIEWVRGGKRVPPEKEGLVHLIGFVALMALIIVISANDIIRLIQGISPLG